MVLLIITVFLLTIFYFIYYYIFLSFPSNNFYAENTNQHYNLHLFQSHFVTLSTLHYISALYSTISFSKQCPRYCLNIISIISLTILTPSLLFLTYFLLKRCHSTFPLSFITVITSICFPLSLSFSAQSKCSFSPTLSFLHSNSRERYNVRSSRFYEPNQRINKLFGKVLFNGGEKKGVVLGLCANEPASEGGRPSRDPVDGRPRSSHLFFFFSFSILLPYFPLTRSTINHLFRSSLPAEPGWQRVTGVREQTSLATVPEYIDDTRVDDCDTALITVKVTIEILIVKAAFEM